MKKVIFFLPGLFAVLFSGVFTLVMSVGVIASTFTHNRPFEDAVVRFWAKILLKIAGARVKLFGVEKIPAGGVIYVFNHTSLFDIPSIHASLVKSFRFGAKAELFKIPIFGPSMARAKALKIERSNLTAAIRVYDEAKERVKNGESFILAPEGTRQKQPKLGEFKTGPFILAINTQAPIVPIVLKNVHRILPKGHVAIDYDWSREIELHILDPISTEGLTMDDRNFLRDKTYEFMRQEYEKN